MISKSELHINVVVHQVRGGCELDVRHRLNSSAFCLLHDSSGYCQTTGEYLYYSQAFLDE